MHVAIVGAGFTGAVIANRLAEARHTVTVFESRPHLAGNCHTERDAETGVMLHAYGPHIFHTDHERTWSFITGFGEFMPYVNRVKAITRGRVYSLPINLLTINQFFGKTLRPAEARKHLASIADHAIGDPANFREQALKFVGRDLYEAFFEGYTRKQWGMDPEALPASILKRLPVRFNYDDNYYSHKYQGIPRDGYTALVQRMLDRPGVEIHLNTSFDPLAKTEFDHVFFTGPIDAWFGYVHGRLAYRTLDFEVFRDEGDYQGNAVINYCEQAIPFTRITEHKHFAPWEDHARTVCYREYSRSCGEDDVPYYPIRLADGTGQFAHYVALAEKEQNVTFAGRLATYRYLDMDVSIKEALEVSDRFLHCAGSGESMPAFVLDPLGRKRG